MRSMALASVQAADVMAGTREHPPDSIQSSGCGFTGRQHRGGNNKGEWKPWGHLRDLALFPALQCRASGRFREGRIGKKRKSGPKPALYTIRDLERSEAEAQTNVCSGVATRHAVDACAQSCAATQAVGHACADVVAL